MVSGVFYFVGKVFFNCFDIVSVKECEELNNLSFLECLKFFLKVEIYFYRGYLVIWNNFWFIDN